ncbi:unnamed protein product [Brassica rapa subsp. narinosa]
MDPSRRQFRDSRYANLFDLEPLMNFRIPRHEDESDYYGSSSQDETRGNQGGVVANYGNGVRRGMSSGTKKRKRWIEADDDVEDGDDHYSQHVTEEHYRAMLGEHMQRFKSRSKETRGNHTPLLGVPVRKSNVGANRGRNDHHRRFYDVDTLSNYAADPIPQRRGSHRESNVTPKIAYEPSYLDIGEGVVYKIPPSYDKLVASLNLPSFSDIHVDDFYLKGALDLRSLAELMARDKRSGARSRNGMGEPRPQYDSLQARVKALSASSSSPNFSLKVSEDAMNSVIPEGAAGTTARTILSEGGVLQVHYVKVLEKGDTYEIVQRSLPKKLKVKNDPAVIEKTERDKIRKAWINIVRRDIPKHHRVFTTFHRKQSIDAKRFADGCQREVKMKVARSFKLPRSAPIRTRKISRDMLLFWKRFDKQMAEERKKQEKEAAEALKREQELREAQRQQQRLNFLIKQTELYSHFMQNKTDAMPSESLPIGDENLVDEALQEPSAAKLSEMEDPEDAKMKEDALNAAREAVSKQRKITDAFDTEYMKLQKTSDMEGPPIDVSVSGSGNIDLHNPSTMPVTSTVQTPEMFKGTLKEYQMKGLQWLVNCYEQGLNGILADEMGLGKTIQAMAFLAHLAEEKNIWGPFLVVAPASVLNNWADEISRFCPDLKTLPYWGGLQERTILRKNINPKRMYRRDAGFHILITSYQLLVTDEKYFRRVKWQYMVLDEAQAIKSSTSIRWKTLLSFNCRNRLLLTGTPIQNNMAELWALLHFIMPMVFDSHEQFNEWFSKGIENHAEHGGTLNEHQLNRLHAILKPFMLRRVKKDVVSELTTKTEVTVHCKLSSRQQAFYQAIKNKISLAELFDSNRGHFNDKKILNLMNIVIQLRKASSMVCNHPELFERNEGSSYLYFGVMSNSLLPPPFGELEDVHYSGGHNPITYEIPKLLHNEMLQNSETFCSSIGKGLSRESFLKNFNIFSPEYIHRSTLPSDSSSVNQAVSGSGAFAFSRLMDLSPSEVGYLALCSVMERLLFSILKWERQFLDEIVDSFMESMDDDLDGDNMNTAQTRAVTRMLLMPSKVETSLLKGRVGTGPTCHSIESLVISHQDRLLSSIKLLHSAYTFIPKARAPPISVHCSDRNSAYRITEEMHQPWLKRLLIGFARTSEANGPRKPSSVPHPLIQEIDSELPVVQPALQLTHRIFGSCPPMQSFDPAKLLTDSGKLQTLDILLKRLRAGNHRVLLFAQMTKMLNILEDYMNYRKYKYLRLDGSSTIMDRRDMVRDFQQRNDIFVFLLSTRAGGLGINLTAADTVIFYESDWNPTLDLQAMDRAHRLGQTKDVTVYRLICKETVEEKILHRASQKNTVQQLVMTGGHVQGDDVFGTADVVSLLMDDAEAAQLEQKFRELPLQVKDRQKKKQPMKRIRIDAEGDATLEELDDATERQDNGQEPSQEPETTKPSNKKRKAAPTPKSRVPQKAKEEENGEGDDTLQPQRTKRVKRQTKSVNESLEPVFSASVTPTNGEFNPSSSNVDAD